MNSDELKEQWFQYAENNLTNDKILEGINELLDNIGGELYNDGYTSDANKLWNAESIIEDVLNNAEERDDDGRLDYVKPWEKY